MHSLSEVLFFYKTIHTFINKTPHNMESQVFLVQKGLCGQKTLVVKNK